jgi:hypothetical protein
MRPLPFGQIEPKTGPKDGRNRAEAGKIFKPDLAGFEIRLRRKAGQI